MSNSNHIDMLKYIKMYIKYKQSNSNHIVISDPSEGSICVAAGV